MKKKSYYFTPEGYRRLEQNPLVDRNVLQFFRKKVSAGRNNLPLPKENGEVHQGNRVLRRKSSRSPHISDEAARLIATALKGLLRDK